MSFEFAMPEPALAGPTTAGALADRLVGEVKRMVEEFEQAVAPGFALPGLYGGHVVLDDTKSDLLYVLGLLVECGITDIAGHDLRSVAIEVLSSLDPAAVEGFSSYRVGETALRLGGLQALPAAIHQQVLDAVDTPTVLAQLDADAGIPPNFAIVAARALRARTALEGSSDDPRLAALLARVESMFESATGWIDDGIGAWVHYDIYTPDMYLFAEPLTDRLGARWEAGLTRVLADLDHISQAGGAIVWGRSIGALGMAITIELAAVAAGRDIGDTQNAWLARAATTLDDLCSWFPGGVIAAHQHRSTMAYRGPARRLQMTLDIYGKLLLSALELRRRPEVESTDPAAAFPPAERLVEFDPERPQSAAWGYRSSQLSFVLPTVFGFSSDYLPSPRGPGLFEQPTSGHPVLVPVITPRTRNERTGLGDAALVPAALPVRVEHRPGSLTVAHEGWAPVGSDQVGVAGRRTATYTVEGRTLVVREHLEFDAPADLPGPVTLSVAQTPDRPLEIETSLGRTLHIDTDGVAEWRSFWGPLPSVHQIEIEPAASVDFVWRVTPRLRVAHSMRGHPYDRALYGHLSDDLVVAEVGLPDGELARRLRDIDVVHIAWPEWWSGTDPARTRNVLDQIQASGTSIVWTQHNLIPHLVKTDDAAATYQLWAEAAHAVIHHTEAGRAAAQAVYAYGRGTSHHVIEHGHWGHRYLRWADVSREDVELAEGWPPCGIRLAVVGSPRAEKDIQLVVDAVVASRRDDIQLVVRADLTVSVPDDPRIVAEYGHLSDDGYHRRMRAFDALVLPFTRPGMLTTGTAFDAIGAGVPAITSDWDFFDETFAGADIRFGTSTDDLTRCIDGLTPQRLKEARRAMIALQPRFEWAGTARRTLEVLESAASRT